MERTIEFYKSFGMVVYFDEVQETIAPTPEGAQTTNKPQLNKKKTIKDIKDELNSKDFDSLGKPVRVVGLTFGDATGEIPSNRVHLIFEDTPAVKEEETKPSTQAELVDKAVEEKQNRNKTESEGKESAPHQYEYLVVYIHLLGRFFTRISGKHYTCLLKPTDFNGVKMAILEDPNGIHVRFIELAPEHLVEGPKGQQVDYNIFTTVVFTTRLLFNGNK